MVARLRICAPGENGMALRHQTRFIRPMALEGIGADTMVDNGDDAVLTELTRRIPGQNQ